MFKENQLLIYVSLLKSKKSVFRPVAVLPPFATVAQLQVARSPPHYQAAHIYSKDLNNK